MSVVEGEVGLVAGRSQREKKRSYKDLLREEEEMAAQDSELLVTEADSHKKKKKHSSDEHYHRDHHGLGPSLHKKKRKSSERSPSRSSSCSSQPSHSTDTAMGLLQAITSPMAIGFEPGPHHHKKPSYPHHALHSSSKDRKHDSSSKSSHSSSHSYSHSRHSGSSKKHQSSSSSFSTKSSLFHSGVDRGEPLTLRDAEGLKMKLILSPKEKNDGEEPNEGLSFPVHSSSGRTGHPHSSSGSKKDGMKKEKDRDQRTSFKPPKKKHHSREPLPVVGKEVEVQGHYSGSLGGIGGDCSSSGAELEAGELIIDDSYTHLSSKKKKKSKKSKKKKDKEKDRDKEKSSKEKKHSKPGHAEKKALTGDTLRSHSHSHSSSNHSTSVGMYAMAPPASSVYHESSDLMVVKKKKKEEKDKNKHDKDKRKKKSTTAYQVFCKEYRVNISAEQPGIVFGELSKKLAEVWKHLPDKEKQVWKQKAQYIQHKQIKAEATTVKQKSSSTESKIKSSSKVVALGAGLTSPGRSTVVMRVPEIDPIDAAAHLQLLGESLSLIGHRLQETEGMVAVSGSLSVLLDSILCALGPLTCLTAQVPQLNGCPRSVLSSTLDNIAYIMPGL